jgi:hypothetical protein
MKLPPESGGGTLFSDLARRIPAAWFLGFLLALSVLMLAKALS